MKRPSHFKYLLSLIGSLILGIYTYIRFPNNRPPFHLSHWESFFSNLLIYKTTLNERLMKYIRRKTLFVDVNTRIAEIKHHSQFLVHLTKLKITLC